MSDVPVGSRPVIGITAYRERTRWSYWHRDADVLPAAYADAVADAGGSPLLIPARPDAVLDVLPRLDALLLSGGPDVDPKLYYEASHPATGEPRRARDAAELAVLEAAVMAGKPVLAVCRGAQLLNVWRGGTLEQHIHDASEKLDHGGGGTFAQKQVRVLEGSWLSSVVGKSTRVNCHHHQALRHLGSGLREVAWAEDGIIEAVELEGQSLVLGVQWHPEEEDVSPLFSAFVEQSREVSSARTTVANSKMRSVRL